MSASRPRTAAGRALLRDYSGLLLRERILAIEAEAAAAAVERVRAALWRKLGPGMADPWKQIGNILDAEAER